MQPGLITTIVVEWSLSLSHPLYIHEITLNEMIHAFLWIKL